MRKLHLIGLALVAVFALSAVVASAAMAESEFLVNGEPVAGTSAKIAVSAEGTLLLEDTKGGIFGEKVDLLCSGKPAATIESATLMFVNSITEISCTTDAGICPEPEAKPDALPWDVEISLSGTTFIAKIKGFAAGWTVVCSKSVEDECTAEEAKGEAAVELENMEANDVLAIFSAAVTPTGNCKRGGKGSAIVRESVLFAGTGGNSISVS